MSIALDHIAIPVRDPESSARFLADILGTSVDVCGPEAEFRSMALTGGAFLLFQPSDRVEPHHMAFRVSETAFADVVARLRARGMVFGNDPEALANAQTTDPLGGKGRVYFTTPDGHLFEVCAV